MAKGLEKLWKTGDYWAIWLGIGIVLLSFGLKPFWAPTIGVAVTVSLGYFLSTVVFSRFWGNISEKT